MGGKGSGVGSAPGKGGARPGAGRPPKETISASQVKAMLDAAKRKSDETGRTLDDILLEIVYDAGTPKRERLAGIRLFKDFSTPKIAEGGPTDKAQGPGILLPEETPPDNVVRLDKGNA
jgi:hypothetical protein